MAFGESEVQEHADRPMAGLYFRTHTRMPRMLELGADVAPDLEDASRVLVVARAALGLYPFWRPELYVALGGGAAYESYGDSSAFAGFAEGAVGSSFRMFGTQMDLRAAYFALMSSDNTQEAVSVTLGFGF
jgi:hypothetical protein